MDVPNAFCYAWKTVKHSVVHRLLMYSLLRLNNQSTICIARNSMLLEETKHIESYYDFHREKIKDGAIITYYVKSDEQLTRSPSKAFTNSLRISLCDEFGSNDILKPNVYTSARNDENTM